MYCTKKYIEQLISKQETKIQKCFQYTSQKNDSTNKIRKKQQNTQAQCIAQKKYIEQQTKMFPIHQSTNKICKKQQKKQKNKKQKTSNHSKIKSIFSSSFFFLSTSLLLDKSL